MATSQAASSGIAAAVGGTAIAIRETVVESHLMEIECFSATKDLGVGKSFKSSTFSVGGHGWYIECYPCGADEENAGCVSIFLCLSAHKEEVKAECYFNLVDDDDGVLVNRYWCPGQYNAETSWRAGIYDFDREDLELDLESLFKNDCFKIRCDVCIVREFPALPPPDLHRPHVGGEHFTVHSGGLRGSSTYVDVAASATSAAGASTAPTMSAENVAGSHVLTIHGYSNAKKAFGEKVEVTHCLPIFLDKRYGRGEIVKVQFELTLLTLAREVISSTESCYAFTSENRKCCCYLPFNMEPEFSPFQDSFHVKCDVTVVEEITPLRPPDLHRHFGDLLASQVGTDVEFEVGGDLFSAHKIVLATRSTAFMAEFFRPGGNGGSTSDTRVRISGMEPRVFKALLHFIYTDTLPDVRDDDKIGFTQGLLVAADRYAMERLKLICADKLCNNVNNASTAVDMLELADKHGCRRLKEKCMKLLKGHFAKVTP